MRIGIDLGGTKIEAIALDVDGREQFRHRVATPRGDYRATIEAVASLVTRAPEASSALASAVRRSDPLAESS